MKSGIYQILNKINNKSYVGKSIDIECRWGHHISFLLNNKHHNHYLQRAWNKYGEGAFIWEVLEEVPNIKLLGVKEVFWIMVLESYNKDFGYNLNNIIDNKIRQSEETKKKISEANKGNQYSLGRVISETTRKKLSKSIKGYKHTEEAKKKISEFHKGNKYNLGYKHSEETKRKKSESLKGNKNNLGHKHTEETKKKISEANKGKQYSLGYKHTEESKKKMKGRNFSEDHKRKISEAKIIRDKIKKGIPLTT